MTKRFDSLGKLLLAAAAVPIVFGVYSLISSARFVSRAEQATGTVIAMRVEKPWPGKRVGSFPVIEFIDTRGVSQEVEIRSYTFPVMLEVGASVRLLFDPSAPKQAIPDSWRARWAQPLIGIVFGCMLLGAAFFIGRTIEGERQAG